MDWDTVAFQAELNILEGRSAQEEGFSINQSILDALPNGTVKKKNGLTEVKQVALMRDRHKKRAREEAKNRAAAWLTTNKLSLEGNESKAAEMAADRVKQTFWLAYLKGGHSGDWSHLTEALRRELARLCDNSRSEK